MLEVDAKLGQHVENCARVAEIFVEVEDGVVRLREGDGALPAESFFDLPRGGAIFLGQAGDGLRGVEVRGDRVD